MPTYDYQCRACGSVTELIHSMLEDGPTICERCGGDLRRVLYPTGIIFKGSGFYRTDSRSASADGATVGDRSKTTESGSTSGESGSASGDSGSSSGESGPGSSDSGASSGDGAKSTGGGTTAAEPTAS